MRILALDTSTEWLSVATGVGDDATSLRWHARDNHAGSAHSGQILPLIQKLLQETNTKLADIDVIAYGAGPGSFTGVRIACSVAQGLALARGIPLVGVSGLQAIAYRAYEQYGWSNVVSILDARMHEVYVSAFRIEGGVAKEVTETRVCRPDVWLQEHQKNFANETWYAVGDGLVAYPQLESYFAKTDNNARPQAQAIGKIGAAAFLNGETLSPEQALPHYVRQRVALTIAQRQAGEKL